MDNMGRNHSRKKIAALAIWRFTVTVPPSGFSVQFQTVLRQASPFSSSAFDAEAHPPDSEGQVISYHRIRSHSRTSWPVGQADTRSGPSVTAGTSGSAAPGSSHPSNES